MNRRNIHAALYQFMVEVYKLAKCYTITNAISPDGLFVDRILTKPKPFLPLGKLIERYRKLEVDNRNTKL